MRHRTWFSLTRRAKKYYLTFPEWGRNGGGKKDGTKRASVAVGAKWEISDPPPPFYLAE